MKNALIATVFLLSLVSCKTVLLKVKGVKSPKLETYASTKKYLDKNDVDSTRVVYFKDLNSLVYASKNKMLQVPNALFFDKKGHFVDYRKSATDCNAKVDGFIQDLNAFGEAKKDSTKTIIDFKRLIVGSDINRASEQSDITVFITWARYAGALNKEKAFDWVKLLEQAKQKGIKVNYYLLNCDFQEMWNLTQEQKEGLDLN